MNRSEAPTRWIVDPLDGTTPWVWGNFGFSISVALEERGRVTVGAVYDPVMREFFFYAQEGRPATRNGVLIHPAEGVRADEALMVVDWGNRDDKRREGLAYFQRFLLPEMFARRVVPQFAPALGLCRIAEGRIHALICNDTWVEDHAAGAFILQQAGGHCSNFYRTDRFSTRAPGISAACDAAMHRAITALLCA
jgi:myo-inositol-1(or 4)-monophosphatase